MIDRLKPYPMIKDSGVAWLGAVPEHWDVRKLGQIGRLSKGNGGNKEDEVETGVPCVRYGDLYTTHTYFILKSRSFVTPGRAGEYTAMTFGDVLFAASGETIDEIGKSAVNLMRSEARCGGDVILFRPEREVEARFMGYVTDCRPAAAQKASMGRGITVKHIYGDQLKYLTIALPPVAEQTAIVRFLDHMDRRIGRYIRVKQKLLKLLEEQKQAIVHRAVTRGLDPNVRLKSSGVEWLEDVPEHWEVARLGRVIALTTGFPFKSEGFTQSTDSIRLLRGINISPGQLRWDDIVRWPTTSRRDFAAYELQAGDIVLGMDRPIIRSGVRVAKINEADVPSLLLQRVARIRPRHDLLTDFLLLLLAGKSFSSYLSPIFTGISVPHLSPEQIRSFRFALPSIEEQEQIVKRVAVSTTAIQSAMDRAQSGLSLLGEYRTRLIADVVTGKLDVRHAAAQLPRETEHRELEETGEPGAYEVDLVPAELDAGAEDARD